MLIKSALRKRLVILMPKNYRKIVVDRLLARGIKVHPNTVYNVLHEESKNVEVAIELMKLYNELNKSSKKLSALSAAIVAEAA